MQALRRARLLARFVLAGFLLALGAAIANPIVHSEPLELICSDGTVKLVALGGDAGDSEGEADRTHAGHLLDCPLCMPEGAPLPAVAAALLHDAPAAAQMRPMAASPRIAVRAAAPLPPRGPPALS